MKKELQERLFNRFDKIFEERHLPMSESCMAFGIETGDGWFNLIWDLCKDLEKIDPNIKAVQVKEKFAGLRFYTGGTTEEACQRIHRAEEESYKTCESCGAEGSCQGDGWLTTLCEPCDRKRKEQRASQGRE